MKNIFSIACIFLLCTNAHSQKFDILINNINIIPIAKDTVLQNQCIGIKANKIVCIGRNIKATAAKNIDGTNKYIMPSMTDMHIHWPEIDAEKYLKLCIAAGITKVRVMNSKPEAIGFVHASNKNNLPQLIVGFPIRENSIKNVKDIPRLIDSIKKAKYDFIKIFSLDTSIYFKPLMAAAKLNNMTVCGHAIANVPAKEVLESGYKSIEHVGYLDKTKNGKLDTLLQLFAANKTFICPTLDWEMMVYHSYPYDSLPNRMGYKIGYDLYKTNWDTTYANVTKSIPETDRKKYEDFMANRVKNKIQILAKAKLLNISILAGSDAEEPFQTPGFTLIEEMLLIQKAGYTNYELLKTATINPAIYFNEQKVAGTIELNKHANLIILTKNPLEDIKNLQTVESTLYNGQLLKSNL
jgi:imidazolonepropionase-like amidohydrolase